MELLESASVVSLSSSRAPLPAMQPSDLLAACVDIVATFEPAKSTVDAHHADYCARRRIADSTDAQFLHQVAYGCQRYKRLLKVFLSSFYFNHSGEAARSDQPLYTVLAYLAILRLEELTFAQFQRLALTHDGPKVRVFLAFLFSEASLTTWLKEGWLTLYEPHYVQTELIDPLLRFQPQAERLVAELDSRQAAGEARRAAEAEAVLAAAEGRGGAGRHTVPEPFNLSRPAPRLLPEPTELLAVRLVARKEGARPWERSEGPPKDRLELEKKMEQNRLQLRKKYAVTGRPALQAEKRPTNLEAVAARVEAAASAQLTFKPEPPKAVPKWDADEGFVKLNAAAILREDQVYRRKQAEEARLLAAYESELVDSRAHDAWLAAQRRQAEEEAREALDRRRVEAALADEMAKAATEASRLEKRAQAARQRAQAEAVAEAEEELRGKQAEARRRQVSAVAECHRNGALAVEAAERRRQQAAEAVREESKALEAERRRALAEEEERRQEVIREIRALELVPRKREAVIDPTYEPGHGLLEEMSLAELRERLAIVAAREAEATQLRRQDIIRTKQQAQEALAGKVGAIAAYRKLGAAQAADERARAAKAKAEREAADRLRREDAALQLESAREALRAKGRAAEAELAAELKRIKVKSQFLGKDTAAVEAAKYGSLERGAGREAAERQRGGQASALRQVQLKDKERAQRSLLQVADAKARVDWAASQALRFQNSAFDATLTDRQAAEQKQLVAAAARESHERSRAAYADAFPFTHAVNEERKAQVQQARQQAKGAGGKGGRRLPSPSAGRAGSAASGARLGSTARLSVAGSQSTLALDRTAGSRHLL